MSLSEISNEIESLSSLSQSSQSLSKVDLAFIKSLSNESILTKKSFSFENQNRSLDLSNDDHLSTDQHSESDEESSLTEIYKDHLEIGLPKILRFTNKISRIASRLSFDKYFDDEIVNQTQNFFRHTLDEYLNGGIICQFCQKSTFNWEDSNNCCLDYKEYVEGLIDHNQFQEALRQSITIDNFRSTAYMEEIKKKKALIQKRISEIKKLERNVIKPKFKIKFDKPIRYNKVVKKQSIKPNESAAILTINKRVSSIVEKDQIKEESEKTSNLGEPLSNVVSFKSSEEKAKDKINYSLSNREFIEQGWTVLYKNALKKNQKETEPEPQRDRNISVFDLVEKIPMQFTKTSYKYYNNGSLFELMLSDQTGTIYYPNGNIAIVISIFGNFRSFIAFSNQDKNSIPLAYFDSNGNGFCNYCSGKLRYQLNHYGAINFDENGKCIRRWLWPSESKMNTFRPIISRLNDYMSIKMFTRDRIVFSFRSKQSSCKFIVSTKTENPDNSKKKFEHFKNTISDPVCKKLREKSDLLLKILAKGFPSNLEEEKLNNLIKDQEDTFYVKLPKIKNPKPASIVSRISFNHSSIISTERDKLSLDSVSKKGSINFSYSTIK